MPADLGAGIVAVGVWIGVTWMWRERRGAPVPSASHGGPAVSAAPHGLADDHETRQTVSGPKAHAIHVCRLCAEDYDDAFPKEMAGLRDLVDAWERAPRSSRSAGWAVFKELGQLAIVMREPLLRDPKRAVLEAILRVMPGETVGPR